MKKLFGIMLIALVFPFFSCAMAQSDSSMRSGQTAKEQTMERLVEAIPVPKITNANEREMIARRAVLFDVKNKLGYVYLIANNGAVIGYYSIFGKMASLNSFLVPQQRITDITTRRNPNGSYYTQRVSGWYVLDDADLDGTYGSNIEGVFFFTDNGTYVELPTTAGITPVYSDKPLPITAVKFN